MTLRTATSMKSTSDANPPGASTILAGVVGDDIDTAAMIAAGTGKELLVIDLNAVIDVSESTVEIIQSGGNLSLNDVLLTLREKGFRASARPKKARVGGQDRVTLTIAWNV